MNTMRRIKMGLRGCSLKPSLRMCLFDETGYHFDLFGYLICIPAMDRWTREPRDIMESWGVYYFMRSVVLCWGRKTKHIRMPWDWEHRNEKHEVLAKSGKWVRCIPSYMGGNEDEWDKRQFDYTYTTKRGEVQKAIATVHAERREWRWLWVPFIRMKRQDLCVEFDREMGERAGSWKGGVIGTGHNMQKGETMEQTLRRMEKERNL